MADEVTNDPIPGATLPSLLTFDTSNTPISPTFAVNSLDAMGFQCFNDFAVVGEGLGFNPFNNDANDWEITFSGAPVRAFAIDFLSSNDSSGESFSIFSSGGLLGSTTAIPDGAHSVIFLGVVSTEPITRVFYDEGASDGDNTGLADLRFSPVPEVPEPGSFALFGLVFFAAFYHRPRRLAQ